MSIIVRENLEFYWQPRTPAQEAALASNVQFLLFGGAAGALKSETLLINSIRHRDNRFASSIIFRRSFPELDQLITRSRELYQPLGAKYNEQKKMWTFPSGMRMRFGFAELEKDIHKQYGNEYDFVGFDESTGFTEYPVRFMWSRLRSKDPELQGKIRMHLATNPGGVGHIWHKHIFLGPTCTHCRLVPTSRIPFKIYTDTVWPSDGRKISKTTTFIPGRLSDHNLLGDDYRKQLDMLPAYLSQALKDGCWDVFAGAYFDCWKQPVMTMSKADVYKLVEPWWPCWIGIDYGFNISSAVAYLFTKGPATEEFPAGRTFVLDEYAVKHQKAADFARSVEKRWHVGERKIIAHYLSPDAWAQRGDGHTLADQMTEATGINFQKASNDRAGGAMLLYTQLDRGDMVINRDQCPMLVEAIPSRVHDPDEPDKVLKIPGDPMDDCFDAWRYGAYSYVTSVETPLSILREMAVTSSDPTIAHIQRMLAEQKYKKNDSPVRFLQARRSFFN